MLSMARKKKTPPAPKPPSEEEIIKIMNEGDGVHQRAYAKVFSDVMERMVKYHGMYMDDAAKELLASLLAFKQGLSKVFKEQKRDVKQIEKTLNKVTDIEIDLQKEQLDLVLYHSIVLASKIITLLLVEEKKKELKEEKSCGEHGRKNKAGSHIWIPPATKESIFRFDIFN